MNTIRIVIVDDHPYIRQGVSNVLAYQPDIEVVGEAKNAAELFRNLEVLRPDVILLDIKMPGSNGIEVTRRLKQQENPAKVIILTTYEKEEYLVDAIKAGAEGYLLKSASPSVLAAAIRKVIRGERLVSPEMMDAVLREFHEVSRDQTENEFDLDETEIEILKLIAGGATNREIAQKLFFSEVTAKRKVQEILEKLDANNRAQAAAEAVRRGFV